MSDITQQEISFLRETFMPLVGMKIDWLSIPNQALHMTLIFIDYKHHFIKLLFEHNFILILYNHTLFKTFNVKVQL